MATPIRDYRDLDVWKQAIELAIACDAVCDALPQSAGYLCLQMRRAVDSIHSNIAEGNGRSSLSDYLRLLGMSKGSINELGSRLHFVHRRYGPTPAITRALELTELVARLHGGLVRSLRAKRKRDG